MVSEVRQGRELEVAGEWEVLEGPQLRQPEPAASISVVLLRVRTFGLEVVSVEVRFQSVERQEQTQRKVDFQEKEEEGVELQSLSVLVVVLRRPLGVDFLALADQEGHYLIVVVKEYLRSVKEQEDLDLVVDLRALGRTEDRREQVVVDLVRMGLCQR
jgi:hypothetical protein